ncbi:MAG TPA: acyl-CoA dehydrogenase family protein [Acidimicrobiales bacterium]|nr:acyl-CoA dehydrogenase family protein [Acidimicrobiales bacterium]
MTTSTEPRTLAEEVRAWVEESWSLDLTVREWWRRLVEAGYAYPTWPAGAGGSGRSSAEARTITGVLAEHGVVGPPTGHLAAHLAAPTILAHGTPEQITELVRPIATGEAAWCQLFSEPGSGSDLASIATRAERDGDEWIVSGQKIWNSAADRSDMGMLLARTDVDQPKHHGITYFAIDMLQPGVEVRPLRVMDGTAPFCEVFLTEARVRADHQIGALDEGWRVAQTTLASERSMVAGGGVRGLYPGASGSMGDLDRTVGEVIERTRAQAARRRSSLRSGAVPAAVMVDLARQCGRAADPVIRQELSCYWSQVKVNGWTMRRSAAAGGRLTGADGSIAKLTTARICQQSRDLAYRIAGAQLLLQGPGSPMGGDLQRVGLASPGNRLGGGTDEIQLNVLGEKGLGLPREPDSSKDLAYRDLRVGTQRRP